MRASFTPSQIDVSQIESIAEFENQCVNEMSDISGLKKYIGGAATSLRRLGCTKHAHFGLFF